MRTNDEIIDLIKALCIEKDISLSELARRTDMAKSAVSRYFNKSRQFPLNRVNVFAKALNTTPEYLLNVTPNTPSDELSPKDQRDISRSLDEIMEQLEDGSDSPLMYGGVELSDTSKELLRNALGYALTETKKENKVKYNPNKKG